jgi:DNA-binding transcriptional LysR family regulator
MKQQQILALVKIADTGSIRGAAELMNTSQSALTRAMRELEESLGAEILNRSYRGVSFTPAGEALLKRARLIVETIERAQQEVRQISAGKGAKVAVAITPVVAATVLGDIYRQFKLQMPDAQLVFTEGLLTSIVPGLIEGRLDFGVAIASQAALPSELIFDPLADVLNAVAGREGHPLAGANSWSELLEAPWVLNQTLGSSSNAFLDWLETEGLGRPKEVVQCTSPQIMLEMMRHSDLIGLAPARYITDPKSGSGVVPFNITPLPPLVKLGIVRVRGVPLTPAAQLFETLVKRLLQSNFADELSSPIFE